MELPDWGPATLAVPAEAVADGEIHLRGHQPEWEWNAGPVVQVLSAEGPVEQAVLSDQPIFRDGDGPGEPPFFGIETDEMMGFIEALEAGERFGVVDSIALSADQLTDGASISVDGFAEPFLSWLVDMELVEGQEVVISQDYGGEAMLRIFDPQGNLMDIGFRDLTFTASTNGLYELDVALVDGSGFGPDFGLIIEVVGP